jgi:hypothetical protein
MILKRRLAAAALPAAGLTLVAAALALTGQPANAAPVRFAAGGLAQWNAATTATAGTRLVGRALVDCDALAAINVEVEQCDPDVGADATGDGRGNAGYGYEGPGGPGTGTGSEGPGAEGPGDIGTGASPGDGGPTRGNDGYGGVDEVPPGGEIPPGGIGPDDVPPATGVSPAEVPGTGAGGVLPVTGSPLLVYVGIGGLLTAAGVALRILLRRRP